MGEETKAEEDKVWHTATCFINYYIITYIVQSLVKCHIQFNVTIALFFRTSGTVRFIEIVLVTL